LRVPPRNVLPLRLCAFVPAGTVGAVRERPSASLSRTRASPFFFFFFGVVRLSFPCFTLSYLFLYRSGARFGCGPHSRREILHFFFSRFDVPNRNSPLFSRSGQCVFRVAGFSVRVCCSPQLRPFPARICRDSPSCIARLCFPFPVCLSCTGVSSLVLLAPLIVLPHKPPFFAPCS